MMQEDLLTLLQNGADANTKDANGFTLMMHFSRKNDIESLRHLLSYAAEINVKDAMNFTALDYAIKHRNFEAVEFLIHNGAHVSSETYMLAIKMQDKYVLDFLDSLDPDKYIFLKNKKSLR